MTSKGLTAAQVEEFVYRNPCNTWAYMPHSFNVIPDPDHGFHVCKLKVKHQSDHKCRCGYTWPLKHYRKKLAEMDSPSLKAAHPKTVEKEERQE